MEKGTLLLQDHKKTIRLTPERMTVYIQSKIIEAFDDNNQVYYLFFYNDVYLSSKKATRLRRNSHIEYAFKKGIIFDSPHPLIAMVSPANSPLQTHSLEQLIKRLEKKFTPQETALILTFFESFIPKKILFKHIQSIFYQFRRDGQLFAGYQILQILIDFAPKNRWAAQLANQLQFKKYADQYTQYPETMIEQDVIFAEKFLNGQKEDTNAFQQLESILENQSRFSDLVALSIHRFSQSPTSSNYHALLNQLKRHLSDRDITTILQDLSLHYRQSHLQSELLDRLIRHDQTEEAIQLLFNHNLELNKMQRDKLSHALETLDLETTMVQVEKLTKIIGYLYSSESEKADNIVQKCIKVLIKRHDLSFIRKWLEPLKQEFTALQSYEVVDRMYKLSLDPNEQQLLGQMYFELNQWDKAIECFSWEMELKDRDPRPVQWLSKAYKKKGLSRESKAYEQLYIEMQKDYTA